MAATVSKKKVSTSSDSHIHEDIALSILSKLPIKSLKRFTCANKSWSLLFQNPTFMNMFRTNFLKSKHDDNSETRLLIKEQSLGFPIQQSFSILSGERFEIRANLDCPLPFQQDHNANAHALHIFILGSASVNGTLCLYQGSMTVLWNPATSELKIIPPSYQPMENKFPPHGFGYDCVRNDFKLIRKVGYPIVDEPFWEIYSLKSDSWRKLDGFDDMPVSSASTSMVNLNGFCHWFTGRHEGDIVSFDFINEKFVATTLPSSSSDVRHRSYSFALVELNESLSVIYNYVRTPDFHIWVLGEVGVKESWIKLLVVEPSDCSIVCPVTVGNKNHVFFWEEDSDDIGWIDISTQRVEKIEVNGGLFCSHMAIFKESLLPFPRNE